jgi:transcriptional antiterminator
LPDTPLDRKLKFERREEIFNILSTLGRTNVSMSDLARRYQVSVNTIKLDIEKIADQCIKIPPQTLKLQVDITIEKARIECLKVLRETTDNRVKLGAIAQLINLTAKEVEFAQVFGILEKPNIEITQNNLNIDGGITIDDIREYTKRKVITDTGDTGQPASVSPEVLKE